MTQPFNTRIADSRDRNAILSSWLQSYWADKGPQLSGISRETYYVEQQALIKRLLDHEHTIALVACDPEDDKHLFSWIVASMLPKELVVHYVFTFAPFRAPEFKLGLALFSRLMEERGNRKLVATHKTFAALKDLERNGFTFNPYRIPA